MTNLYVPRLGDRLTLTADWTFLMQNERRNRYFFEKHPDADPSARDRHGMVLSKSITEKETEMTEIFEKVTAISEDGESKSFFRLEGTPIEHRWEYNYAQSGFTFLSKELVSERPYTQWCRKGEVKIERVYRVKYQSHSPLDDFKFTFPAGTILLVKRVYIRRGNPDFDSITFSAQNGPHKGKTFWASLDDTRYIEFE